MGSKEDGCLSASSEIKGQINMQFISLSISRLPAYLIRGLEIYVTCTTKKVKYQDFTQCGHKLSSSVKRIQFPAENPITHEGNAPFPFGAQNPRGPGAPR